MNDITWANPQLLSVAWGVLAAVAILFWLDRARAAASVRLVSIHLDPRLARRVSRRRRLLALVLLGLSGWAMTIALMQPQWGGTPVETPRIGNELMLCLDVSKSMLADDVGPNRLERAKAEIRDILGRRDPRDPAGLIVFAGTARVLCPLTPDFESLLGILEDADPTSVRKGGTVLAEPIYAAVRGFRDTAFVSRTVLLISDGEDHDNFAMDAAKKAREEGVRIVTIGFGDEVDGSTIRFVDPQFGAKKTLLDADGREVVSRLNGELLREIATTSRAIYIPARTGIIDWDSVYDRAFPIESADTATQQIIVQEEGFPYALLTALGFLLLSLALGSSGVRTRRRPEPRARTRSQSSTRARDVRGSRTAVARSLFLVLAVIGASFGAFAGSGSAWAQGVPEPTPIPNPADGTVPAGAQAAESTSSTDEAAAQEEAFTPPHDPIEAYETGVTLLAGFDETTSTIEVLERAELCFREARERSGSFRDLQYHATYNLAWSLARKAEVRLTVTEPAPATGAEMSEAQKSEIEKSIADYRDAGAWFRRAVSLRKEEFDPRRNLEVVERRALLLEDQIADKDEAELSARLDESIEKQRSVLLKMGQATALTEARSNPESEVSDAVAREERRIGQRLAAEQRLVTNYVASIIRRASRQLDSLRSRSTEELSNEEQQLAYQIEQLLPFLNTALQRMSQARRQARLREFEPGYRRAAIALTELKKARDQLREISERLQVLIPDQGQLVRSIASIAEPAPTAKPPVWLTRRFLKESQAGLVERVEALDAFSKLVLAWLEQPAATSDPANPDPAGQDPATSDPNADPTTAQQNEIARDRLTAALPHLAAATEQAKTATASLTIAVDDPANASSLPSARDSAMKVEQSLTRALEQFLDFRQMINLMVRTQESVTQTLEPREASVDPKKTGTPERSPTSPEINPEALANQVAENLLRQPRLKQLLEDEREKALAEAETQDPSRSEPPESDPPDPGEPFDRALEHLERAGGFLRESEIALRSPIDLAHATTTSKQALDALDQLRRTFFTLVDHLRETAERQKRLSDQVAEAQSLPTPEERRMAAGPLTPTERELAAIATQIAGALDEMVDSGTQNQDPRATQDPAAQEAEMLKQAAELVHKGVVAAQETVSTLSPEDKAAPLDLEAAASTAKRALDRWIEALRLLTPPPPQSEDQDSQPQDGSQSSQPQEGEDGEDQPSPSETAQAEPEPEEPAEDESEESGLSGSLSSILQQIRDREEKRRQSKKERRPIEPMPGEKDW